MKPNIGQGDNGKTNLFGAMGKKFSKNSERFHALGALDELNSFLGVANSFIQYSEVNETLKEIQRDIFTAQSSLGVAPDSEDSSPAPELTEDRVEFLEKTIKQFEKDLPELTNFILPGGTKAASLIHLCRTKARGAERRIVSLDLQQQMVQSYVNRLSDVFFTLARYLNHKEGRAEEKWHS